MIIYPVNKTLFIHSLKVIREGRVLLISKKDEILDVYDISGENFNVLSLNVPDGKYTVRVYTNEGKIDKEVFVKEESSQVNGLKN